MDYCRQFNPGRCQEEIFKNIKFQNITECIDASASAYIFQVSVWLTANDCNTSFGMLSFGFGRYKAYKIKLMINCLLVSKATEP